MLTQKKLKELLHYNPETGLFTRLVHRSSNATIGRIAGCANLDGYIMIKIGKRLYSAHRLAFLYITGEWPADQMDHVNHIRDDNKWLNLNPVSSSENSRNVSMRKNNTSGIVGVFWDKSKNRWVAQIRKSRKQVNIGAFKDKFEAICARKSADHKYGYHENHGRNI